MSDDWLSKLLEEQVEIMCDDGWHSYNMKDKLDRENIEQVATAILKGIRERLPEKRIIPSPEEAKGLTERGISLAVEAVKFHAYNQAIDEITRRLNLDDTNGGDQ